LPNVCQGENHLEMHLIIDFDLSHRPIMKTGV